MLRALNTSATGMHAQEQNVNTISNNISNVNTTGFKKERAEFEDLLYEQSIDKGARSSGDSQYTIGKQAGSGARVTATRRIHTQGSIKITDNPFDVSIQGDGFFPVMVGDKIRYTRDGSFGPDAEGFITTNSGHKIAPGIQVPPNTRSLSISKDGKVDAWLANDKEPVRVGDIKVFKFVNPAGLRDLGGNLAEETTASGNAIEHTPGLNNAGYLFQGSLETSNVQIVDEMTNLIKAQRAYEMNSKVMGVADQMLQTVNNIR